MDLNSLKPEQIKGLISLLEGLLPEIEKQDQPIKDTMRIKNKPKKRNKTNFRNKFDEMMESKMHKEDCIVDKKLAVQPPVPRTRRYEPIQVLCRVCGKKENVNPALIDSIERYKCNKCCSSGGA